MSKIAHPVAISIEFGKQSCMIFPFFSPVLLCLERLIKIVDNKLNKKLGYFYMRAPHAVAMAGSSLGKGRWERVLSPQTTRTGQDQSQAGRRGQRRGELSPLAVAQAGAEVP